MSLIATRIAEVVTRNPNYYSNEVRLGEWGALDFFIEETGRADGPVTRAMQDLAWNSLGTNFEIPVLQYDGTVQLLTSRTCDIPCNPANSEMLQITFNTLGFGICETPCEFTHQRLTRDEVFDFQYREGIEKMGNRMDEMAVAALEAYKTQVIANTLDYPFAGGIVSASNAKRMDILTDVGIMMKSNRFTKTPLHIIGNGGVESLVAAQMKLGLYNAINYSAEYANKRFHFTENIENAEDQFATFFAMEPGNVGMLFRAPCAAISRRNELGRSWDVANLPLLNVPGYVQHVVEWGDQSTTRPDLTCDLIEKWAFYVDFAFITKYVSQPTTMATPDIKVQIAGSPQDGSGVPVQVTNIVRTQEVTPVP